MLLIDWLIVGEVVGPGGDDNPAAVRSPEAATTAASRQGVLPAHQREVSRPINVVINQSIDWQISCLTIQSDYEVQQINFI